MLETLKDQRWRGKVKINVDHRVGELLNVAIVAWAMAGFQPSEKMVDDLYELIRAHVRLGKAPE